MATGFPAIIRAHWKRLIWMWLWPPAFLATLAIPAFSRDPAGFFLIVDFPAMGVCFYMASKPVRRREITVGQGVILVILLPFMIWVVMISGLFGLAFMLRALVPR